MDPAPPRPIAADLAPGDAAAAAFDWSGLALVRIRRPDHPLFDAAYGRLWEEFGQRGEMETRPVIAARLDWDPRAPIDGRALLYELLAVEARGELVAVRDHTAIHVGPAAGGDSAVVVHLSHVLVAPRLRGTGLAGWLRALPVQTARQCAAAAGCGAATRVTLVAEMEHPDGVTPAVMARLRSYERAGFSLLDPDQVPYRQPDFRPADVIDRTGVRPLPLALVVRRVGREAERCVSGAEVRRIVAALYRMFGATMAAAHMAPLWTTVFDRLPPPDARVALRPPATPRSAPP